MDYKVDKKSFYNMMNQLFNKLYGDDFTEVFHEVTEGYDYVNRNKQFPKSTDVCFCTFEDYSLMCSDGREMLRDRKVIKSSRKEEGGYFVEPMETNNDNFIIDCKVDEVSEIISPFTFEYPFLVNIPAITCNLAFSETDDGIVKFDQETIDCIIDAFKEYKACDDQNRDFMFTKIRSRREEL